MVTACACKKWNKWQEVESKEGVSVVKRTCKRCGWVEYAETGRWNPEKFRQCLKQTILSIMKEIEEERNLKNE